MTHETAHIDDRPANVRAERWARIFRVLVVAWAVAMSGIVLYGLVLFRSTQLDGLVIGRDARSAAESAERGTARIEDCTTPGRVCFTEGQKRSGKIIGVLTDGQADAAAAGAWCATKIPRPASAAAMLRCVKARMLATGSPPVPPQR